MRSDPRHQQQLIPNHRDQQYSLVTGLLRHGIGLVVVGVAIGLACWPLNMLDRIQSALFAYLPTRGGAWTTQGLVIASLPVVVMPVLLLLQRGGWKAGAGSGIPSTMNALEDPSLMAEAMAAQGTVQRGLLWSIATAAMFPLGRQGRFAAATLHQMLETMKRAYRDRAAHLGDADFVDIPAKLTSKAYAHKLVENIHKHKATPSEDLAGKIKLAPEGDSTTHFSVIDADGLAVSNTYTLEQSYGSRIVVRGAGFLLNNEMGDFNPRPGVTDGVGRIGTAANLIAPGKRMLSSQCPTIVAAEGKPVKLAF